MTAGRGRIADIEVLRAWAILWVLFHHALFTLFVWRLEWTAALRQHVDGGTGVDLFFAISGFVIARSLLPRLRAASGTAGWLRTIVAFWIRRVWRLFPSAWLWLALTLAATAWFNHTWAFGDLTDNRNGVIAAICLAANARIAMLADLHDIGATGHYWSLSLEEQFYLALPVVAFLARRRLAWVLGGVILLQLMWWSDSMWRVMFRVEALLLGVLLALASEQAWYRRLEPVALRLRRWRLPLVTLLVLAPPVLRPHFPAPVGIPLVALCAAITVWIATHDRGYVMRPGRLQRIFLWIGVHSYALYLAHTFVFHSTREIWSRLTPGKRVDPSYWPEYALTSSVLLILLVGLNHRFVEVPLRVRGARIAARYEARARADAPAPERA